MNDLLPFIVLKRLDPQAGSFVSLKYLQDRFVAFRIVDATGDQLYVQWQGPRQPVQGMGVFGFIELVDSVQDQQYTTIGRNLGNKLTKLRDQ